MKIAITGASGMIGRRLAAALSPHSLLVLGRRVGVLPAGAQFVAWDAAQALPAESMPGVDAVIHLAGEPVAQRWSAEAKRRILASREAGTRNLVQGLGRIERPPRVLVCASAIGIYGSRGDEELTESSSAGEGFLPDVCRAWEREADAAAALGVRVVKLRLGIVLAPEGGALREMLPPFRMGVGGRLGSGRQWMSWIHVADVVGLVGFALENEGLSGAVNATAPLPVRNAEFTSELGRVLHRPTLVPIPGVALKVLFGEMAEMLLGSQRVLPRAAEAAGYRFQHAELPGALQDIFMAVEYPDMKKPVGATTLSEYFQQIEEPRKSEMKKLHELISKTVPKLKPAIHSGMIGYGMYHYKYASGREGDWPVVALASQKNYISVYVCAFDGEKTLAERRKAELGKVDVGKSCIRFKKLDDVDVKVLLSVVKEGARMMLAKTA